MTSLIQIVSERLYWGVLVYGVLFAVIVYIIKRQMKNSDNEPGKVILKWIVTLTVIGVMIHTALTVNILIAFIFVLLPCALHNAEIGRKSI